MLKIKRGGFELNGRHVDKLIGRSSFKLSNIITYHFKGQGGGKYSLGEARRWVDYNQRLFGENVVLRVFLETAGWEPRASGTMFGSPPQDLGFWELVRLRDGARETGMHYVGRNVLEWFFRTSHETGVVFELVIDATLKHNNIPKGEIDHVIRQVGLEMGRLSKQYPNNLVIPNCRNEWDAHNQSGHSLHEVNMWAVRWLRDQYWPGSQPIVDGGGGDKFEYEVGPPGSGKFAMGLIHPDRGDDWWNLPDIGALRRQADGMPVGFNESMYYVEPEDVERANQWYRHPSGWTSDFDKYREFAEKAIDAVDYFIFHDEKGVQCDTQWPRPVTRLEEVFGQGETPPPTPPPPPPPPEPPEPPEESPIKVEKVGETLSVSFGPVLVKGGSEDFVVKEERVFEIPEGYSILDVWSFHGLDRGDIVEMDTELWDHDNAHPLVLRSEHKEEFDAFDAWAKYETVAFNTRRVRVVFFCRVNGVNSHLARLAARPHWGLRIVLESDQVTEEPPPSEEDDSKLYVTRERADGHFLNPRIANSIPKRLQSLVWAGNRDVHNVLVNCPWQLRNLYGMSIKDATEYIDNALKLERQGLRLKGRLALEHEKYSGRTPVLKSVIGEWVNNYDEHMARAWEMRDIAQKNKCDGAIFDSIAGLCQQCPDVGRDE